MTKIKFQDPIYQIRFINLETYLCSRPEIHIRSTNLLIIWFKREYKKFSHLNFFPLQR
jgi:hypothetical protein